MGVRLCEDNTRENSFVNASSDDKEMDSVEFENATHTGVLNYYALS